MSTNQKSLETKLWAALISVPSLYAEAFSEALADKALAVTTLAPPRQKDAKIEALFDFEPDPSQLTAQVSVIAMLKQIKTPEVEIKVMPNMDWLKKVSDDFPPISIGRFRVHGSAFRSQVPIRRYALEIDATNAFGTGEHPTTKGCLLMLDWLLKRSSRKPRRMLDMGCGSGILALATAKACHAKAIGVDLDHASVVIAKDNARKNGLKGKMKIALSLGYRSQLAKTGSPYDLIMSNIFAGPLCHMAADLKRHLKPGGTVILAGLLNHQESRVLSAHRLQKLYLIKRLTIGEWSILALKYPKRA